jgi:hypothetical protein
LCYQVAAVLKTRPWRTLREREGLVLLIRLLFIAKGWVMYLSSARRKQEALGYVFSRMEQNVKNGIFWPDVAVESTATANNKVMSFSRGIPILEPVLSLMAHPVANWISLKVDAVLRTNDKNGRS